jgi:hypothetical protein
MMMSCYEYRTLAAGYILVRSSIARLRTADALVVVIVVQVFHFGVLVVGCRSRIHLRFAYIHSSLATCCSVPGQSSATLGVIRKERSPA